MADVTISGLNPITPSSSLSIPASDGTTTGRVSISQINSLASGIPIGTIVMWSNYGGAGIPTGWALCDGQAGRPDLRNRFIVGSGSTYNVGNVGGSADAIVVSHTHSATSTVSDPGHAHNHMISTANSSPGGPYLLNNTTNRVPNGSGIIISNTTGVSVSTSIASAGSSGTNANLPPYYALAFIIKIA